MKPKIEISVNKSKVTEGDVVEITWSCTNATEVQLTLDNGYKANTIPVAFSGSKKFRLNRSKGRTHLVIGAVEGGKTYYKSVTVRVKRMKVTKAEEVYDYTGAKGVRKNGLKTSWNNYKSRVKMAWGYLPENKKLAFKIISILMVIMLLSAIYPKIMSLGLMGLGCYLFWILLRK